MTIRTTSNAKAGIEIGGTFTDLVSVVDGRLCVAKVPSTPAEPDRGALSALKAAAIDVAGLGDLAHGSTVATNAVLEFKGARVAFVTSTGFRDMLVLQRHNRQNVYDLAYQRPRHVVERQDCFEVGERLLADGSVLSAIDLDEVEQVLLPQLIDGDYEAVAICLLNAYANPTHESALADFLKQRLPDTLVTVSSDVSLKFREYERASTTVLSAYVQPVIDGYLHRFEEALHEQGFTGRLSLIQSNGGRLPAEGMRRRAVSALLSGPAAGVTGAIHMAGLSGFKDIITFDMGGTSTDVSLVRDGEPDLIGSFEISGLPVHTPVIDINTVGAGGGSIVWIDDGGMLRVGPESAGADPGPACYGRGGTRPTVTDAHVVCGTLRADAFLGGNMDLDIEAARSAFVDVADTLEMTIEAAAEATIGLAVANIVRAVQIVSTERGTDPRDFVLAAFGGAGGLHAASVAEELGMTTALIPANAGVLSAYGLLTSDYQLFETMSRRLVVEDGVETEFTNVFKVLLERARGELAKLAITESPTIKFWADMRYVGQAFEVSVEFVVERMEALSASSIRQAFVEAHRQLYFHDGHGGPVEAVAFRLGAQVPVERPVVASESSSAADAQAAPAEVFIGGHKVSCPFRWRKTLKIDEALTGPALLADKTTTIWVPAGWSAETDGAGNIILSRKDR
jgi:N-methylhydantoinase A